MNVLSSKPAIFKATKKKKIKGAPAQAVFTADRITFARQRSQRKADKERDRLGAPDERGIRGTLIHGGSERSLRTLRAEENAGLPCESLSLSLFYSHSVRTVNHAPVHEGDTATSLLSVSRTASKCFPIHILPFATTY